MDKFEVGDIAIDPSDGERGVVQVVDSGFFDVAFERSGVCTMGEGDLMTEAEFNGRNDPPLADWEKALLQAPFEQNVRRILEGVAETVVKKNVAYGDSALNPIRVFSKTDRMEQLFVRLDDKLSRVQRGHEYPGDDTIRDIIGYCTLVLIARESQ